MYGNKGLHKWSLLCHSTNVMCISEIHTSSVCIYIYIYSYTSQAIMSLKITFTDLSKGDRESMCHPKLQRGTRCDRESMTTGKTLKRYIYIYIPAAALTVTCFIYIYIYICIDSLYIYKYVAGLKHFFTLEATHASSAQEVAYKDALIPQSNLLY